MNRPVTTDALQGYLQLLSDIGHARRNRESSYRDLLSNIESLRERHQSECVQFLHSLRPLLEAARRISRELDYHTAHRFNALSYLRYDELGLSKIIADLLDPSGVHGQGSTFLKAILELLSTAPDGVDAKHVPTSEKLLSAISNAHSIQVETEQAIDDNRRIDVIVDIWNHAGVRFGLAFENKPYAGDQFKQCEDYLKFLKRRYRDNYLLVYTPPRLSMPSDSSLPNPDYWEGHFCVLPYTSIKESYEYDDLADESKATAEENGAIAIRSEDGTKSGVSSKFVVGDGASLADWFGTCSVSSNAERMRWFLKEAQRFCQQHFGGSDMTDTEARYIKEHLEKNPEQVNAAYAVARAWPDFLHGVFERFLLHIAEEVRIRLADVDQDLKIKCRYKRKGWEQYLTIYRDSWAQYKGDRTDHPSEMRTAVHLQSYVGLSESYWGVSRASTIDQMTPEEADRQRNLSIVLSQHGFANSHPLWLHYETPKYSRWEEFVGEIAKELDHGTGEITDYYIKGLLNFVLKAVPIIDAEELENKNPSS